MQTIIQVIETQWTKRSRGAPGAHKRSAVPNLFTVPYFELAESVVLQHVVFSEYEDFEPAATEGIVSFSANDSTKWRICVHTSERGSEIQFFGMPFTHISGRPEYVGLLEANTWLQIVGNRRFAEEHGWAYRKFVYNVAFCHAMAANTILRATNPIARLNYETHLW